MKKAIVSFLFILAFHLLSAQSNNKIILGTIDSINSKILNEQRKIWVYVPNSGSGDIFEKTKYPVVYLLDGDAHFYSVVGMIQQLSSVNGNMKCPEMIVVGIPNTDRTRDLTPTHVFLDRMMNNDSNATRTSGGGEKFISFIEKELMPYIDSAYPTLPYKTFIGHSFGGLTVMNTLINHKDLFNNYIALDPSMWWDKKSLLSETKKILGRDSYKSKTLFLAIANTMPKGMDTVKVKKDTSLLTSHIRSILELNNIIQRNKKNGINYDYKYYKNDNHGSVPLIGTYDALRFIFSFYDFSLDFEDFRNFSMKTVSKIENHFKNVSTHFGFKYGVPENMANQFAYLAMSQKKMKEAEYLFKLNVDNYPASFNVYDSMGDFYQADGNKEKAIEYFKKALSIREFADTRNKLNALLAK